MNRVISWKRLAIVAGVLLIVSAATFGVHELQVRRQADTFKTRAYKMAEEADGDSAKLDAAIELLDTYMRFKPRDEDAFRQYVKLQQTRAKADPKYTRDTADALDKYLRLFPDHPEERRQLIDVYFDLGNLVSARQHILILFDKNEANRHDVDLLDKAASCEEGLGDMTQAVKYLDDAIATRKAPPRLVERMLDTLLKLKAFNDPRYTPAKYIEVLVNQEPYKNDVEARIAAGSFLLKTGELENARRHITDALAMPGGSSNAEALIAAADLERAAIKNPEQIQPQLKKAREHLERAFALDSKNVRVGIKLAETLTDAGELKAATDVLKTSAAALGEKNSDQMQRVLDGLLDLGELDLSLRLIERIEANEADRKGIARYFRGRVALIRSDWGTARTLLEGVLPKVARIPDFHKRAAAGLAQCYAVIQNPDKQLEFDSAALRDDPRYLPALIGQADALLKLGRYREALAQYRVFVNAYHLEAVRATYAKLELRAAAAQSANRSWEAFEASLGPEATRTSALWILYADSLIARGDLEKAGQVLEAVLRKDSKNAHAWLTLARITSRGAPGNARKVLEDAAKTVGDSVELRLARSIVLLSRTTKPSVEAIRALAANAEKFEKAERRRLFLGLGEAASASSHLVDAESIPALRNLAIEYFLAAADLDANDLLCRATLVDLGNAAGRNDVVERALAEIAKVEGAEGPFGTLARAIHRMPEVRAIQDKAARAAAIAELRALAGRARASRPGWDRVYVLLAQLDELDGLDDSALANYKEAIDRGFRQEWVVRRAVELYRERRRDDEAALLLNSLHTEMNLPEDLERFRAIKDLLARDVPSSERPTIDRIAPADSKEWRILLLRGSLLAAIGADADANAAFQQAVSFGDNVPETWSALVTHFIRLGRIEDARRATREAERKIDSNPPTTPAGKAEMIVTIAGCHELIGDLKTAEVRYRAAVELAPRERDPNRDLIKFLKRTGRGAEAEARLRALIDAPEQDLARWARRYQALSLIAGRDRYEHHAEALQLIDQNLAKKPIDTEDEKARAVILTNHPTTREEGMKSLKEFAKWGNLTPDEYMLLGKLFFEQGRVQESVDFFEQAAKPRSGLTSEHIAALIRVYAGLNLLPQARNALARLKHFAPRSWIAAREEARLLHREAMDAEKSGRPDEAKKLTDQTRDLILNFPDARTEESIRVRSGPLLEELGFLAETETHYRRLLTDAKLPYPHFPLAGFLIRQKRTAEAIALAKKYDAATPPALTARIFTGAIRTKSPSPAAEREVADWLETRLKHPADKFENLSLLMSRAELFEGTGQYDKAIAGYEDALLLAKPARAEELRDFAPELIANNLAMLLALYRPAEADRAIQMMNEVIALRGPEPVYLDTRAVCFLVKGGKTDEAEADLKLALIQQKRPAYLFHLGWAYDLTPSKRALREEMLEEAKKLGLTAEDLHPMEARKFNELYRSK